MKPQDSPKSVIKQSETPVVEKDTNFDPPSSIKRDDSASSLEFVPDPNFVH